MLQKRKKKKRKPVLSILVLNLGNVTDRGDGSDEMGSIGILIEEETSLQ